VLGGLGSRQRAWQSRRRIRGCGRSRNAFGGRTLRGLVEVDGGGGRGRRLGRIAAVACCRLFLVWRDRGRGGGGIVLALKPVLLGLCLVKRFSMTFRTVFYRRMAG